MILTQEEVKWLEKVKNEPDRYRIDIDNDEIYISEKVTKSNAIYERDYEEECVFTFDDFGQDFIVRLLNTMGYNADWV